MQPSSGRVLVTGASGFVGRSFVEHAIENDIRIRLFLRRPMTCLTPDSVEVVVGDLVNTVDWTKAVEDVEVVVNTAAEIKDTSLMQAVNVLGPERLLEAAVNAGVKRWVQLSSVGSYGPITSGRVCEDWPDRPSDPYELSKTDFDTILKQAAHDYGIEFCIVRPSNVYGADMSNQSIRQMLSLIRKNLFVFVGPEGASANYVHVKDVVQALNLCVNRPEAANQTYIVSDWATIEEMVVGLAEGAGVSAPCKRISLGMATMITRAMQWYPRFPVTLGRLRAMSVRSRYSTEKIENELGWKVSIPVKEGMREFARSLCR